MNHVFSIEYPTLLVKPLAIYRQWRHARKTHNKSKGQPTLLILISFVVCIVAAFTALTLYVASLDKTATVTTPIKTVAPAPTPAPQAPTQNNPLFASYPTWSQNFATQKTDVPDPLYWNILVGPANNTNNEKQYYTDNYENVHVKDGYLSLIGTHNAQPQNYQYGSARLETQGKKSFLYGRIDVSARLPAGIGTWPAFWLLPDNSFYADKTPNNALRFKNGGELDVMESVGFQPDVNYGIVHTISDITNHPDGSGSFSTVDVPNSTSSFNTYSLLWTPTSVSFAVNNKIYYTYQRQDGADYTTWPFDQPFYLIANLALGGSWGGHDTADFPGNGIDNGSLPASFDIQSIYYYPYIGSTTVK